jgi:TonB family protein
MESDANLVAAEGQADTPCAQRLVIRVVLPKDSLQAPARRGVSKGALLLVGGAAAALLSWFGVTKLRTEPTPAAAVSASPLEPEPVASTPAPAPADAQAPVSAPDGAAATTLEPSSSAAQPVEPEASAPPDGPPTAVNEVLPDVPQSALDTIRGTVRVSIRVIIDEGGSVLAAVADDPGPSRYFERLSLEASKNWTFTPAPSEEQRIMLVRFHYTRGGVTARANLPE